VTSGSSSEEYSGRETHAGKGEVSICYLLK
jgi:hypothetical protein